MALPESIKRGLSLPAICAPMSFVSGPDLARECCKAGIIGTFPRHNAASEEEFEQWLIDVRRDLDAHEALGGSVAPLAVNASLRSSEDSKRFSEACKRARVNLVISAFGDPTDHIARVHDWGGLAFHDVTSIRFAEKALRAGADGLIAIGAGGGGHSGTISHLALIPRLRRMFDGVIVMAGAVNASLRSSEDSKRFSEACKRARVNLVISAFGDPTDHIARVHDWGGLAFHDVTNIRFAEKALRAGVDGLIAIGAGGGGHSGTISHLALIPRLRRMFDGVIVMAGAVTTGAAIRAAEILGADLAYLGTRFIASEESLAKVGYKQLIVESGATDLFFSSNPTGVPANWLKDSLRQFGLDPDNLPARVAPRGTGHYPAGIRSWRDFWSAGQGIELIDDVPPVAQICSRLRREYIAACEIPASFAQTTRLAEEAFAASRIT